MHYCPLALSFRVCMLLKGKVNVVVVDFVFHTYMYMYNSKSDLFKLVALYMHSVL